MHTTFRVYGSAIGRTALGCRTVGRGFKSVARMKGGVLPDELPYDRPAFHEYRSDYGDNPSESDLYSWNTDRELHQARNAMNATVRRSDAIHKQEVDRVNFLNDRMHRRDDVDFIEDTPEEIQARNEAAAKRKQQQQLKEIRSRELQQLKKEIEKTKIPDIKDIGSFDEEFNKQLDKKKKSDKLKNDMEKIVEDAQQQKCWVCKTDIFSSKQAFKAHISTDKHKNNLTKMYGEDVPEPVLHIFENKPKKVVGENDKVHEDEGFLQNETIAVAEKRVSQLVFDDKLIYKEREYVGEQLGAWNPNYDDFNELENTDLNQDEIIDIDSTILNQQRSAEYLKSLPELTKQLAGSIYKAEKVNGEVVKDDKGHTVFTTEIKQSRVWEYGMCGPNNNEASKVFSSVLPQGQKTDFKTSDEIAVTYNITGGNSLPVDLIDKKNMNASESKYYTKVEYVRMYNINMKNQKHYYEDQKELLKKYILKIKINPEDDEAIKNRDKQLKILNSKQSFLRSFYANTNYMSVNIGAGKWGNVPDNVTEEIQDGLANATTQINNYKKHVEPKIQLSFNKHRRMVQWNVKDDNKSKKRSKEQLTEELSNAFFKNAKGKSIDYGYTVNVKFKDGVGLYNYTNDDYLNDCNHIVQGYRIGASYDQHGDKGLYMDAIKIPIEKFIPFGLKFRKKSEIIVLDSESDED